MLSFASAARLHRYTSRDLAGGLVSLLVAGFLFSRVGIDGFLFRDEAIYAYGGQQMTHGVAPYVSIFDPKAPLATFICGIAAEVGHVIGIDDLTMMRLAFFALCVLTALAVYLLAVEIWGSVLGGVSAAVVFASFRGFAQDALRGPDAHSAGPLFAVLSMWLALRKQWFWAAFAGSLATLVKQTNAFYTLAVLIAAVLYSPHRRSRALAAGLAGAVTPFLLTLLYFAAKGAVAQFWESAVLFPARGLHRAQQQTIPGNVRAIVRVFWQSYNFSGILFWIGMALLLIVAAAGLLRRRTDLRAALLDPPMFIVGFTLTAQLAYLLNDFLSYDDLYQVLPYSAFGFGAVVALATRRLSGSPRPLQALTIGTAAGLVLLFVLSSVWFVRAPANNHGLPAQRAMGCAINRILPSGTRLYSLGNPVPLVLTHRRNPDRYIYLESGVTAWKIEHTAGGFAGWVRQVTSPNNSVVILQGWVGRRVRPMVRSIKRAGYLPGFVGAWRVFVSPEARRHAVLVGLDITRSPTRWPLTSSGARFRVQRCGR